jgi:cell division protein FtsQ
MKLFISKIKHFFIPTKNDSKTNSENLRTLKKQNRLNKIRFSFFLLAPLTILLMMIIYLVSPLGKINSVTITGTKYIPVDDIKKELKINVGDSMLKVLGKTNQINRSVINEDNRVKNVNINLTHFNHLKVIVTPYKELGYETHNKSQYLILENGNVTNINVKKPNDRKLPYIVKFKDHNKLKAMVLDYLKLPKDIRDNIRVISYSPTNIYPDELHLYMRDGNRVIVLMSNFNYKMKFYRSIATELKARSMINLEVGAYSYPLKNEKIENTPLSQLILKQQKHKKNSHKVND